MKGCNEKLMILISRLASPMPCPDTGWSQGEMNPGLAPKCFAFSKSNFISILYWAGWLVCCHHFPLCDQRGCTTYIFRTESCLEKQIDNVYLLSGEIPHSFSCRITVLSLIPHHFPSIKDKKVLKIATLHVKIWMPRPPPLFFPFCRKSWILFRLLFFTHRIALPPLNTERKRATCQIFFAVFNILAC